MENFSKIDLVKDDYFSQIDINTERKTDRNFIR